MKTENEIIAEFMGGWNKDPHTRKYGINIPHMKNQWWDIDELQYHASWDWLMPVVEKIENMGHSTKIECNGISTTVTISPNVSVWNNPSTKIDKAYKAVVQFIKWYNEQKVKQQPTP